MRNIFCILILAVLFTACSIHRPGSDRHGYGGIWTKEQISTTNEIKKNKQEPAAPALLLPTGAKMAELHTGYEQNQKNTRKKYKRAEKYLQKWAEKTPPEDTMEMEDLPPGRVVEPNGVAGFACGVLGMVAIGVASAISFPGILLLIIGLFLAGIILSVVSLGKFKHQGEHYWGKGFALAGMFLSLLGIITMLIVIAVIFLIAAAFASLSC